MRVLEAAELGALRRGSGRARRRRARSRSSARGSCRSSGSAAAPRSCGSRRRCCTSTRTGVRTGMWISFAVTAARARVADLPPPLVADHLDGQPWSRSPPAPASSGSRRGRRSRTAPRSATIGTTIPSADDDVPAGRSPGLRPSVSPPKPRRLRRFQDQKSSATTSAEPEPGAAHHPPEQARDVPRLVALRARASSASRRSPQAAGPRQAEAQDRAGPSGGCPLRATRTLCAGG